MGDLSENKLIEEIIDVGCKLLHPPVINPELLSLLDEVECILAKVGQAPSRLVQEAIVIPMKALIADDLLGQSDPNLKITIASCLSEIMRITAPIPPYDDDKMREIFELMVSSFEYLSCQPGRCYSKAVSILQSVAKLRSCVMLLDIDCDLLVLKMFELFLRIISPKHPEDVLLSMASIMCVIIKESDSVSPELLKALLASIRMENRIASPAACRLGAKVFEGCADKLRPFIMKTVSSMGCCLGDYALILSSICNTENDTLMNDINDSSFLVNSEPSDNLSDPAETESFECVNALRTEKTASKRRRKHNPKNIDEEASGLHQVNDKPSGNINHPVDHNVQSLEALEGLELGEEQALKASESFEDVNALVTGGTVSRRESKSISKNLVELPIADDCIAKNNGIVRKDTACKITKEEIDVHDDNQACHSPVTSDCIKKKRGRPRKTDILEVSEDKPSKKKKKDVSTAPRSTEKINETPHQRKSHKDDLVGRRIKVWWPDDRTFYEGTITNAYGKRHRVAYVDGDQEILTLAKERWEFIGDESKD